MSELLGLVHRGAGPLGERFWNISRRISNDKESMSEKDVIDGQRRDGMGRGRKVSVLVVIRLDVAKGTRIFVVSHQSGESRFAESNASSATIHCADTLEYD